MEHDPDLVNTFRWGLAQLNLNVPLETQDRVLDYFVLLLEKNQTLNLISARQDSVTRVFVHLVDSLTPLLWTDWPKKARVLDIGSGGGLPGFPLALVFPGWQITLAESIGKKAAFLSEVANVMNLSQVSVLNSFLEPGRNRNHSLFDIITARAVKDLKQLAGIVGPRLRKGGRFLAFKGPQADQELAEARPVLEKWRLGLADRRDCVLPLVEARRCLLLFTKD